MTDQVFIQIHLQQGLNQAGRMHLNVNQGANGEAVVSGVILHIEAYRNRQVPGASAEQYLDDIETVLEQVEKIKFSIVHKVSGQPDEVEEYELTILNSSYFSADNPFFYFSIEPTTFRQFNVDTLYEAQEFVDITLTPYILGLSFEFSDANPLFSNAFNIRKSKYIMQSDRLESTVLPTNSASLYDETAEKALIQDSMYFDTGWSRARYSGTSSTAGDNAGIPPTISGRSFLGETFSKDTTTDYICKLDDRLQNEFFHDGNTQLPRYYYGEEVVTEDGDEEVVTSTAINNITDNYSSIPDENSTEIFLLNTPIENIVVGSVLKLFHGTDKKEYLKVTAVGTQSVDVIRGYKNSPIPPFYAPSHPIYLVEELNIYKLDAVGGSRLNAVGTSRIYVEGNNTILETDSTGFITSQSLCPTFNIDIADGQSG
jgi:hypothetical protein